MMFSAFCPVHDARVLLTRRNVLSFWNGDNGPVIRWKCTCGHEGFLDHHGDRADDPTSESTSAPAPSEPRKSNPAIEVTLDRIAS